MYKKAKRKEGWFAGEVEKARDTGSAFKGEGERGRGGEEVRWRRPGARDEAGRRK